MKRYYEILQLNAGATEKDLKEAFRRLSKKYHPDKNDGSDQFVENFRLVKDAYERILVFMNSTGFNAWKTKNSSREKQSTSNWSKSDKDRTCNDIDGGFDDREKSDTSSSSQFSFYEFINKSGLFEEDVFQSNSKAVQKQHSLDEVVLTKTFEYKILNFKFLNELENRLLKTKADGVFLVVEVEIKNISRSMFSIHNYMYRLFDYEGYFYEFSNKGLATMNLLQEPIIPFFGRELNPRIKATHKIIFEVPEIGDYFLLLCGGQYKWDNDNICICDESAIVKLATGF